MKSHDKGKGPLKNFYSTSDAAEHIGVCRVTILRYIERGKIKALRLPGNRGQYRIRIEELEQFINKLDV